MAITLTKTERNLLKVIMKTDGWDALMKAVALQVDDWSQLPTIGGTDEFQTLKSFHTSLGKVEGLIGFLDRVEALALGND